MSNKLLLLGLNEINFEYLEFYISKGFLPNFKNFFEKHSYSETTSESKYELLEPWIQWVTVQTGKTYDEHQIFRLGDIVNHPNLKQIWESLEENNISVGAVAPMNGDNRLKNAAFFVPDPWTDTKVTGSKLIQKVSKAVDQAVNDNAQDKLTKESMMSIVRALLSSTPISDYSNYLKLVNKARKHKWFKAMVLDKLLASIFVKQWKKSQPNYASLFLNAGAHIQHHYMYNSAAYDGKHKNPDWYCPADQDPLLDVYKLYDSILAQILKLNTRVMLCTGLHQDPYGKVTFYWRLTNHDSFLKSIGITKHTNVLPRMSRDFLAEFASESDAQEAQKILESFEAGDQEKVFIVDNRGKSLFVTLVYPNDFPKGSFIKNEKVKIENFNEQVAFVAIKNGEHNHIGYFADSGISKAEKTPQFPLKEVYHKIQAVFNIKEKEEAVLV